MSVSLRRRPKRNRVPSVAKLRETVRTGPAAEFYTDGGPTMSLARIAALPEPEWARRAYSSRHGLPLGWLRTVDMVAVAASRATVAENLTAIAEELHGPAGTAAQMLLTAQVARLAAELAAEATTTYDHRPLNVAVGRELPAEETAMPRQWFDEPTPEQQAAAAQRDATRASWRGLGLADGTPPPMLDPFHDANDAECGCTQCIIAATVALKTEPVTASASAPVTVTAADEPWPFLYSPAQLDGTACARCGQEFADGQLSRPVPTDECNEQFVHSDLVQCGPAVAPWNDGDDTGTEGAR